MRKYHLNRLATGMPQENGFFSLTPPPPTPSPAHRVAEEEGGCVCALQISLSRYCEYRRVLSLLAALIGPLHVAHSGPVLEGPPEQRGRIFPNGGWQWSLSLALFL